jgi:hypothetical protein
MCANITGRAQAFLSASDAAVSQEVVDGKISIQSAWALNTRYNHIPSRASRALIPTADCLEAEENTKSNDNNDRLSWQEVREGGKKEQIPETEK